VRSKVELNWAKCDVMQCSAMFLAEKSSKGDVESLKGSHGVDVMDTEVEVP
jgi:hypothetical protein